MKKKINVNPEEHEMDANEENSQARRENRKKALLLEKLRHVK